MNHNSLIQEAEIEIKKQQSLNNEVDKVIEDMKVGKLGIDINIEEAKLEDVQRQKIVMEGNVANLIVSLDKITNQFGTQFNGMKEKTMTEKIVGLFSSSKAIAMREDRIKATDIEGQLKELIKESNFLLTILKEQLSTLEHQKSKILNGLDVSLKSREEKVILLKQLKVDIESLDPKIIELNDKISIQTDAEARVKLEIEKQQLINQQNEMIKDQDVALAESQSHEKYIKMYQTFADSIENQIATQKVLVNKLENDTKNRIILYEATSKSLLTAQQQDTAYRLNDIGMEVDTETTKTMAIIGVAANNAVAGMFEKHSDYMQDQEKIQKDKAKADEMFFRRMQNVIDEHNNLNQ